MHPQPSTICPAPHGMPSLCQSQSVDKSVAFHITGCWSKPLDALGPLQERAVAQTVPACEDAPPAELVDDVLSNSYQRRVPGSGDMRHGSEGWHALETSCKVVLALVSSCHAPLHCHCRTQASGCTLPNKEDTKPCC